ncbi:unnamed protein product [Closterium sp. Naga37s-1]|nr:unnamed protein product [Closterium sp. Naga37s-1]
MKQYYVLASSFLPLPPHPTPPLSSHIPPLPGGRLPAWAGGRAAGVRASAGDSGRAVLHTRHHAARPPLHLGHPPSIQPPPARHVHVNHAAPARRRGQAPRAVDSQLGLPRVRPLGRLVIRRLSFRLSPQPSPWAPPTCRSLPRPTPRRCAPSACSRSRRGACGTAARRGTCTDGRGPRSRTPWRGSSPLPTAEAQGRGRGGGNNSADEFALAMRVGGVLQRVGVSTVAASGHTLAVTPGGVVLSWGRDWDARTRHAGLLGRADCAFWRPAPEDSFRPGLLAQERVLAIVAGRYFTLAISQHSRLFTWGANLYSGDAPWRHEHDSGFDNDADAAADEFPEKAPAGTAGSSSEREAWRSWLGVALGVPLDRPAAVRVPPHLGSHPAAGGGGGEEGRAVGPEVQSVAAAHHTTFAMTADYKAVSWGEAGPLLGRVWGDGQGQVPANRPGVVGSGGGGGAAGGERVVGLDRQTVEQVSAGEGFAVARLSHGVVYSW